MESKERVEEIIDKIEISQNNPSHPGFNMGFLNELRTTNREKNNRIVDLEQSNADYIKVLQEKKKTIDDLNTLCTELRDKIEYLENNNKSQQQTIEDLEKALRKACEFESSKIEKLEKTIIQKESIIEFRGKTIDALKKENEKFKAEIQDLNEVVNQHKNYTNNMFNANNELLGKLNELEKERERLNLQIFSYENDDVRKTIERLLKENQDLKESILSLKDHIISVDGSAYNLSTNEVAVHWSWIHSIIKKIKKE